MERIPAVYMLASKRKGTLYTGVASDLDQRIWQHRTHAAAGFTAKYQVIRLVWYEIHEVMPPAIGREKQIKAGSRTRKIRLIEKMNPQWRDLYADLGA